MYASTPGGNSANLPHKMEMTVAELDAGSDIEAAIVLENESLGRPLIFLSAIFVGLAVALIIILLLGFGVSQVYQPLPLLPAILTILVDLPIAHRWNVAPPRFGQWILI